MRRRILINDGVNTLALTYWEELGQWEPERPGYVKTSIDSDLDGSLEKEESAADEARTEDF